MSSRTVSWAKEQRCGDPYAKAVLMEIADWTRPDGICEFRRVKDLADVIEISDRSVQRAIAKLEKPISEGGLGLIERVERTSLKGGQLANCFRLVGYIHQPDPAPVGGVTTIVPPQCLIVTPGVTNSHPPGDQWSPHDYKLDYNSTLIPPTPQKTGGKKIRSSISDDWKAPIIGELGLEAKKLAFAWPAGAYAMQADAFVQFHRGTGSRRADWEALWNAWIIRQHESVMRCGKAGLIVSQPEQESGKPVSKPRFSAAKEREGDRSKALHEQLRTLLGAPTYARWIEPCALLVGDEGLRIIAPTPFIASWIEPRLGQVFEQAFAAVCGNVGNGLIKVEAEAPLKKGRS